MPKTPSGQNSTMSGAEAWSPFYGTAKWYLRGFTDYGEKYGTDDDEYNKIFLNPQSWAVLSRLPSADKGNSCFENVKKYLFCDLGVVSHAPASSGIDFQKKYFFGMKTGIRETADFSSTRARGPLSRRRFSEEMRMRTPSITESSHGSQRQGGCMQS